MLWHGAARHAKREGDALRVRKSCPEDGVHVCRSVKKGLCEVTG